MKRILLLLAVLAALMFTSCTQTQTGTAPESGNRHATVILQDGSKTAGIVTSESSEEITITGDDSIKRTIPRSQVQSIAYDDGAAAPEAAAPAAEPAPAAPAAAKTAATARTTATARTAVAPAPAPVARSAQPAAASQPAAAPAPAPAPVRTLEIPAGTQIPVRTAEAIDSATADEGKVYEGEIADNILDASGEVAIPKRSRAEIVILSASQGGRIRGASDLTLSLKSVVVRGRSYSVESESVSEKGRSGIGANKRTATFTGGGAALGAIVGAIAGGGKGAAIGAGAGAGAGALTQILTKGKSIKVPVESVLTFKLDKELRVTAAN